jgi:hypothetical protein
MVGAPRFELWTPSPPGWRAGNDLLLRGRRLDRFQLAGPEGSPGVFAPTLQARRRRIGAGHMRIGLVDRRRAGVIEQFRGEFQAAGVAQDFARQIVAEVMKAEARRAAEPGTAAHVMPHPAIQISAWKNFDLSFL